MLRLSGVGCFLAALLTISAVTASDAKVLRNKDSTTTVGVFKEADALRRFRVVDRTASGCEGTVPIGCT